MIWTCSISPPEAENQFGGPGIEPMLVPQQLTSSQKRSVSGIEGQCVLRPMDNLTVPGFPLLRCVNPRIRYAHRLRRLGPFTPCWPGTHPSRLQLSIVPNRSGCEMAYRRSCVTIWANHKCLQGWESPLSGSCSPSPQSLGFADRRPRSHYERPGSRQRRFQVESPSLCVKSG